MSFGFVTSFGLCLESSFDLYLDANVGTFLNKCLSLCFESSFGNSLGLRLFTGFAIGFGSFFGSRLCRSLLMASLSFSKRFNLHCDEVSFVQKKINFLFAV